MSGSCCSSSLKPHPNRSLALSSYIHHILFAQVWSLFTNCILHLEGNISVWCILLFLHSLNRVYVYASKQKIMNNESLTPAFAYEEHASAVY